LPKGRGAIWSDEYVFVFFLKRIRRKLSKSNSKIQFRVTVSEIFTDYIRGSAISSSEFPFLSFGANVRDEQEELLGGVGGIVDGLLVTMLNSTHRW